VPVRFGDERTLTLEGIDVETLVVPVKIFVLQRVLERVSLRVIWSDDSVGNGFILKVPRERHNRIDFFLVLKIASRHDWYQYRSFNDKYHNSRNSSFRRRQAARNHSHRQIDRRRRSKAQHVSGST
jgi:hypothetical protein